MNLEKLINKLTNHLNNENKFENALNLLNDLDINDMNSYSNFNETGYKRNLVYKCNLFEVFLICWRHGAISPIHDHSSEGCLMKILKGELEEEIYNKDLIKINNYIRTKDNIQFIDNSLGYHKIKNNNLDSISIHIYSPPDYKANVFD